MLRRTYQAALIGLFLAVFSVPGHIAATSIAPIKLDDLFRRSAVVATVHFQAADAEFYSYGVCKTQVMTAYKGIRIGATLYISPCLTYEIGSDYLLFLVPGGEAVEHQEGSPPYPAMKSIFKVADAGYGRMLIEYTCVFEGRMADQSCDYGVKLNPQQVVLPASLQAFPKSEATAETNYYRWVRRSEIEAYMNRSVAAANSAK